LRGRDCLEDAHRVNDFFKLKKSNGKYLGQTKSRSQPYEEEVIGSFMLKILELLSNAKVAVMSGWM